MPIKFFTILAGILAALALLFWLGLQVQPAPFPGGIAAAPAPRNVPLPPGLPAPVERFFRQLYPNGAPVVDTVVMRGRGVIRPFMNIPFPSRFVFVHRAGRDYRHYIEATWFGMPLLKVNEGYVEGRTFFESPMGTVLDDSNMAQAANLALWAEANWFPSIWVTDPRVTWQPVDDVTAILRVPFVDQTETFVVRFDPESHLITTMEAMRYRDAGAGHPKILWITRNEPGAYLPGAQLAASGSAIWLDQGRPWATFTVEQLDLNLDVEQYIHQRGP